VLTFPYAAAFSAFGAAAADYEHHYRRAVNLVIPPGAPEMDREAAAASLSTAWARLEEQAIGQMQTEGVNADQVRLRHLAMVRYGRQLNDLVVTSPLARCQSTADLDVVLRAFEDLYARIYAKGAQFPQAGFEIFEVGLVASVLKVKPKLRPLPLGDSDPAAAQTGVRPAWFGDRFHPAGRYKWDQLQPGNQVAGPAIIELPTTTLVIPPQRAARVDEFRSVWIES